MAGRRHNRFLSLGAAAALAALVVLGSAAFPAPARAQCETSNTADDEMEKLVSNDDADNPGIVENINNFIGEMANFIDQDLTTTATAEIEERLAQMDKNLYTQLNLWWNDAAPAEAAGDDGGDVDEGRDGSAEADGAAPAPADGAAAEGDPNKSTLPALKAMSRQLSIVRQWQTMAIGMLSDTRAFNERVLKRKLAEADGHARYAIDELACLPDSINAANQTPDNFETAPGKGQNKAYIMSRALNRTLALEDTRRRNNYMKKDAALASFAPGLLRSAHAAPLVTVGGRLTQLPEFFQEYKSCFCDPARGDPACPQDQPGNPICNDPAFLRGKDTDIPGILWEDNQTYDFTNPDVRLMIRASMQRLVAPFVFKALQPEVVRSHAGQEEWMIRRAEDGRLNAVLNVVGQMMSERVGGSGSNTRDLAAAVGLGPANPGTPTPSETDSYSQLREATTKWRTYTPEYAARLVNEPAAVARELLVLGANRNQLMNDFYKRMEEMLVMEVAVLADQLDQQVPASGTESAPLRNTPPANGGG